MYSLIFRNSLCALIFFLLLTGYAFAQESSLLYQSLSDIPQAQWDVLAKKKIYFGHQSVGYNLIDGMTEILKEHPTIKLNIIEGYGDDIFLSPVFSHSKIGKNRYPLVKINDFSGIVQKYLGSKADIVSLKLCFTDITSDTDVNEIFKVYKESMSTLHKNFPELTILHFTVPLYVTHKTWKTYIKLLIGKTPWELADNARRNEYNRLVRDEYEAGGHLFDIAAYESMKPDGTFQTYQYNDIEYQSLYPPYSNDDAHLNSVGAKRVAEKFLLFLASVMTH